MSFKIQEIDGTRWHRRCVAREKDGKLGRNVSRLSFHSLRHTFNSAIANADVPLEIRQKLTGHGSQGNG